MATSKTEQETVVEQVIPRTSEIPSPTTVIEPLEVEEPRPTDQEIVYPTGAKLWLTYISLLICMLLIGLDITIVAVAVPKITDHFKTVADIGWYSAAYALTSSAFVFFLGKLYTLFPLKRLLMLGIVVFETGSVLCTFAASSKMLITGRAVTGFGCSIIAGGMFKLLKLLFPLQKLALWGSLCGGAQTIGMLSAPVIGGFLIDRFTWRGCFGINIPLGAMCLAFMAYCFEEPMPEPDMSMPLKEKTKQLDLFSTILAVPAITFLLLALQWGGTKYSWTNPLVIVFFVLGGCLVLAFGYVQYRQGDKATLPPRIAKQRSMIAGIWYVACCSGANSVTEYYLSIYFQGVRGFSATKSGILWLPFIIGGSVSFIASGAAISRLGRYYPFMYATALIAPISTGFLTTLTPLTPIGVPSFLAGLLGTSIALGLQGPQLAVQTLLPTRDVPLGTAMIMFGSGMGSALFVCSAATLFHNRLTVEIGKFDLGAGTNGTAGFTVGDVGLSDIRRVVGGEKLMEVLGGYNEAVVQTMYLPLVLSCCIWVGAVGMQRVNMKEKRS